MKTRLISDMAPDSLSRSISMLKEVINGDTYDAVAARYGITRTAVEKRVKTLARTLKREVGIDGLNEQSVVYVDRLRRRKGAILAALDRYAPEESQRRIVSRVLSDDDIALAIKRTRVRSPFPLRDVPMLYTLLITGARPLEIARLEVRDYLNADGSVREISVMREDAATKRKARPLFFTTKKVNDAIDAYLGWRVQDVSGGQETAYRGLSPFERLFLTEEGRPFEIVNVVENGQMRFQCREIHDVYRRIFRRIGLDGMSTLNLRRTIAARMLARGAGEDQVGEILGISDAKTLRELLPDLRRPLESILRELV
jgi:integrase